MIQLIIINVLAILFNFFNGLQDVGNSKTEIELSKSRGNTGIGLAKKHFDNVRRKTWHLWGLYTYLVLGVMVAFSFFRYNYIAVIILTVVIWLLRVVIFNPVVSKGLNRKLTYLSSSGWDKFFNNLIGEKFYYFGSLLMYIMLNILLFNCFV